MKRLLFLSALLGGLYFAQGLPFGFFIQTVPVILREQNVSLELIGFSSLLVLPWALKFVWAPLVDRFPARPFGLPFGRRRGFILIVQAGTAILLVVAARFELDRPAQLMLLMVIVFLANLFAATQDIATDGLTVEVLSARLRGLGNGLQVAGYRVGMVAGGSALLIIYDEYGWDLAVACMAGLLVLSNLPLAFHREVPVERPPGQSALSFLRTEGVFVWLLILVLYKSFDALASSMLRPWLVDIGKTATDVGYLIGVIGFGAGLIGAALGGLLVSFLGRTFALIAFGVVQGLAVFGYALATYRAEFVEVAIAFDHLAGGLATVALFTIMMDRARPAFAGSDYTVQASIVVIATAVGASISGVIAAQIGYTSLFILSGALTLIATGACWALLRRSS